MHVSLDETIVIYMVGCLYVELAMYDGTMHVIYMVGWNYACMMKLCVGYLICLLCNCLVKYIYICHIYLL